MKTILLIDGNPLMYRAAYAHGESYVAQGIIRYFFEAVELFDCSEALLLWDAGRSRWRSQYYPDYKAQRQEQKDKLDLHEVEEQKKIAQQYLQFLGVRNLTVYGVEADDLIAWFSEYFSKILDYNRVIIVTRDKDLWQLINDQVHVYDPLPNNFISSVQVEQNLGILPDQIVEYKALVGDTSDNIKGVKGIGSKTALKFLSKYGGLEGLLDPENQKELRKTKTSSRVLDQSDELELSYQLVKLPTLEEGWSYLTPNEYIALHEGVFAPIVPDPMSAQIEAELIGCTRTNQRAISSLSEEVKGIMQYLQQKPSQNLSSLALVDSCLKACSRCPLRQCCSGYGPTLPEGYEDAQIMILGRNPGQKELVECRPFVGPAGERLDRFLEEVGLTRRDCWLTNTCKCFSTKNRPPTYGELQACSEYLRAEIDLVKPKLIVSFGNEAMSAVTAYSSGVTHHAGELLEKPKGYVGYVDAWVGIMVHLSAALRSPQAEANFEYGTKKIKEFLESRRK